MTTKWQLLRAFAEREPVSVITARGDAYDFVVINRLEHEDGSGHSFNVTGCVDLRDIGGSEEPVEKTVHVRTTD